MDNLVFNELQNKSKEELERLKMAQEIAAFNDIRNFEKRKSTTTIWTTIIITLGSTFISLIVSMQLKNTEIRSSKISDATKTILQYVEKFKNDTSQRLLSVHGHIIAIYPDYDDAFLKRIIAPYLKYSNDDDEIDSLGVRVSQVSANFDKTKPENKKVVERLDTSDSLEISLQNSRATAKYNEQQSTQDTVQIKNRLTALKNEFKRSASPDLDTAIRLSSGIRDKIISQIAFEDKNSTIKKAESIAKDFGTLWFKQGYYLQFDNMRVFLQSLEKKDGIRVMICQVAPGETCSELNATEKDRLITFDTPFTINVGGYNYKIILKTIDHAGFNPFKQAAYINVLKLTN